MIQKASDCGRAGRFDAMIDSAVEECMHPRIATYKEDANEE